MTALKDENRKFGFSTRQLSPEAQVSAGVTADFICLSIGIEDIEDILWDLDQTLDQA